MSGLKNFFIGNIITQTKKEIITSTVSDDTLRDEADFKEFSQFVSAIREESHSKGIRFLNKINGFSSSAVASVLEPTGSYSLSAAVNFWPDGRITGFPNFNGFNFWYNGTLKNLASTYIITSTVTTYGEHNNWPGGTTTTGGPNGVNLSTQRQFTYAVNSNASQNGLTAGAFYGVTITGTGNQSVTGLVQVECQQIF